MILESGFWLRSDRDEKRLGAKALLVRIELHHLDVPIDELRRRLEQRNAEGEWGTVPITREQIEHWWGFFEPPGFEEISLYDGPRSRRSPEVLLGSLPHRTGVLVCASAGRGREPDPDSGS